MSFFLQNLTKFLLVSGLIGVFLTSIGCKEKDPNPELKDPIYLDLKKIAEDLAKEVESKEKEVPKLKKEIEKEKVRTLPLKLARKKLREHLDKLKVVKQDAHYAKIRAEKRKVLGRQAYIIAFQKGESWPDPKEFELYKVNRRLRSADLNWNKRVPKLQSANPNFSGQKPQKNEENEK